MAKTLNFLFSTMFVILLNPTTTRSHSFSRNLSPKTLGFKKEKLTHLHFFFHDTITSKNPTAVPIIRPAINSSTGFGTLFMVDDPLTTEPNINSKLVGRAQGMYASASKSEIGFLMILNFVFLEGKYNGSTLSLLGHNAIFSEVREMPIVGGSRVFRFARGYAQARTHTVNLKTLNAIVEYNVYVSHY
ncbi:hypothetical protein JCGZ_12756 [Jatropha curcas]|uniref:Dirigent protein n=1 Tax=Jatropha curcas TaxID=180498 RepID=A0A067KHI1_JATCU|nr:dirigent protein 22 [Jatropha curcas]KDP34473.1 hypothetical protein JCGZ_12756 [Jatropha curcas]